MLSQIWLLVAVFVSIVNGLQIDLPALEKPEATCIRDFVGQDQLVVINLKTSGYHGDGQKLQLSVIDTLGNQFYKKDDISGDVKAVFNTHNAAAIDICLLNRIEHARRSTHYLHREVVLDVESGAAARDWNALQAAEKLKPNEVELKKVDETLKEIANEFRYLKAREERMRDTNESTNSRTKWFSVIIIISLISFGAWQIQYLRHYFKVKHII